MADSLYARLIMPKVLLHISHQALVAPERQGIVLKGQQHGYCQVRHPAPGRRLASHFARLLYGYVMVQHLHEGMSSP